MSTDFMKDSLLLFVTIITCISFIPQLVKIVKTKHAEDLSVLSWVMWVSSSLAYLLFAILEGGFGLLVSSFVEFVLTLAILVLSLVYRKYNKSV